MALQTVTSNPDKRELADWARKAFRKKLDELLDMYESGHPLWIVGHCGVTGPKIGLSCDITLKDWI